MKYCIIAKIHCVADSDCENHPKDVACLPFTLIPQETEKTIREAIQGRDQQFVDEMVEFGMVSSNYKNMCKHTFPDSFRYTAHKFVGIIIYSSKLFATSAFQDCKNVRHWGQPSMQYTIN
jgi:hypothetical protein